MTEREKKPGWFPHERLDVFRVALEFAEWVQSVRRSIPRAGLRNQLKDASESIVLNICEVGFYMSEAFSRNTFFPELHHWGLLESLPNYPAWLISILGLHALFVRYRHVGFFLVLAPLKVVSSWHVFRPSII